MVHPAALPIDKLLKSCQVRRQRRSGPGGQHRNKVETGIFIEHTPTGLRAEATEHRSQQRNQEQAVFRLRVSLAIEHRTDGDQIPDQPSELWRSRIKGSKVQVNAEHADFPAILAEAIDMLAVKGWEPKLAAEKLGCSATQLNKLLKKETRAFELMNRKRISLGLNRLR